MKILFLCFILMGCSSLSENTKVITINFVKPGMMGSECSITALACAIPKGDDCTLYVPEPTRDSFAPFANYEDKEYYIIGHELLHCYGWAHAEI